MSCWIRPCYAGFWVYASVSASLLLGGCYEGPGDAGQQSGTDTDADTAGGTAGSSGGEPMEPAPENAELIPESMARRLSVAELDNTIRDLLGDDTEPASQFLSEEEYTPFDNTYALQTPSQALVEQLEVMARDVSERLVADPTRLAQLIPCEPTGADDAACFRTFIEDFGRRALRRPLTAEEVEAYMTLQAYATEDNAVVDNDFDTAVGLVVQTVLQDPEFLYRIEVGTPTDEDGIYKLDDFEIATRLSYLLLGSTPDQQLLADADAGMLGDPQTRVQVIERLLQDERAKDQLHRYHAMWLGYRGIPHEATLIEAFNQETAALIDRVIFEDQGSYMELFTSTQTYVDDYLAQHYEMPLPPGGEGWVTYDDPNRAGILSHGSVLAAFSKFTDTSPTQRGILIRNRLQCLDIPQPPPDIDTDNPPASNNPDACKEERYAEHTQIASCDGCHSMMDPIGMGLENYDMAGKFREYDDGRPECIISGEGELPGSGAFSGPRELADKLIASGELEACVVQQYLTFALGRQLVEGEEEILNLVLTDFADDGYGFAAMMTTYTGDELFGFRKEPQTGGE